MIHIMSDEFHICDSFEHMMCIMDFDWLTVSFVVTYASQQMDLKL